ncbi:type VI secretion system baseplate subunit TssF [Pseudoalteromonas denitrificans]|uniref:Type VI secretion system protein ImpG n=1 Tax=Pseudoalteromonas denitrificans DSM 6059 TaxID=1123010 RepID=A0A1I1NEH1_9GAMM|nr:type VI secretion system baseplate subunit TssF [Pseudoalteromonas denitrificans]SFC95796.1 type VI secretion system protein ImpG [Pseudoalteromonas denitrificans DSM 6059]
MHQYFDAQMRLLTQAGKQFAKSYPEHAGMLNLDSLKDRDPHIERLLEGVAYLTAHVQQRLDNAIPEVAQQILRQLCPLLLNYYPSTSVLQFTPKVAMQSSQEISKGMQVSNEKLHGKNMCHFQTTQNIKVNPFSVSHVTYKDTQQGAQVRVGLKWVCSGEKHAYDLSNLSFYLCGDTPLTSTLFHLLTNTNQAIELEFKAPQTELIKVLPVNSCQGLYHDENGAILPNAKQSHPSYAMLLDYFNAKDRFCFVNVTGMQNITFDENCDGFELVFKSNIKLPLGNQLSAQNMLINCVPAVNLFSHSAEPINLDNKQSEYLVIADNDHQESIYTYSVESVQGRDTSTNDMIEFTSRYTSVFDDEKYQYTLSMKDIGTAVPVHYLQVSQDIIKQTLSVDINAFNAGLPRHLIQEHELVKAGRDMPKVVSVSNVTRPSNFYKNPEQSKQWQLISLLNLKFSQLTQTNELKRILNLFDWSERSENRHRIESIQSITTKPISLIKRGIFIKGIELTLNIDEKKFVCSSDVYHFCNMLHHFFLMYAPINESVQTKVVCVPSYNELIWQVAAGTTR